MRGPGVWSWVTFGGGAAVPHLLLAPGTAEEAERLRAAYVRWGLRPAARAAPPALARPVLLSSPSGAHLLLDPESEPLPVAVGFTWLLHVGLGAPVLVLGGLDPLPPTAGLGATAAYLAARRPYGRLHEGRVTARRRGALARHRPAPAPPTPSAPPSSGR
ncbi:hypothetical protein [Streptomyces sp. NPDC088923]|uniref:hypothetical protein n=1 Tax=Streptomyces sp. NPDC088923 TaxID=3365913 RepID=UPI0037FB920A